MLTSCRTSQDVAVRNPVTSALMRLSWSEMRLPVDLCRGTSALPPTCKHTGLVLSSTLSFGGAAVRQTYDIFTEYDK